MPVGFYMDVHVPRAITVGLRLRGIDVMTAQEDNAMKLPDADLLDRAAHLNRAVFTSDDDFLSAATKRQREGQPFSCVVYAHQMKISIGKCVRDLERISKGCQAAELQNTVIFLPLKTA